MRSPASRTDKILIAPDAIQQPSALFRRTYTRVARVVHGVHNRTTHE